MGDEKGFEDARGKLFYRVIDILKNQKKRGHQPNVVVLENVRNLLTHNEGKTIVLVTHTKEIAGMANRVITMKSGKVVSEVINDHIVKAEEVEW